MGRMRRKFLMMLPLAAIGLGLAACDDEGTFVEACLADGKGFKPACECTYRRLKAEKRDDVIDAVIKHSNGEKSLVLSPAAIAFGSAYLKCQL